MGFGGISIWQLLIILLIVVMLFGTKRLKSLGSDLGDAIKGFADAGCTVATVGATGGFAAPSATFGSGAAAAFASKSTSNVTSAVSPSFKNRRCGR